jgi:hypothetical protein
LLAELLSVSQIGLTPAWQEELVQGEAQMPLEWL